MNFLDELMSSVDRFESPQSFYYWAGLASISAVLQDKVWIDRWVYKCYPNIYVMFHADSGLKKGPPVNLAKDLVGQVNGTHIISGRSSIQGILKDLGSTQTVPGGGIQSKSKAFICSSELTSSIVEDKAAARILTDLYDRNYNSGDWASLLKMESFKLRDPTITMLTATNAAMSADFFNKDSIHGGYFARTFIIYENKRNRINSLVFPPKKSIDKPKLVSYLTEISKLKGPFVPLGSLERTDKHYIETQEDGEIVYSSPAGKLYDDWYTNFCNTVDEQEIKDPTGTLNRFGDSVLKTAMLIALSKQPILEIDEESMIEAIQHCEKLVGNVRKTTKGQDGTATSAKLKLLITEELFNRQPHMISRQVLSKKFWMHFNSISELDDIMRTFDVEGTIKSENRGNQIVYVMPDGEYELLKDYYEGKNKK